MFLIHLFTSSLFSRVGCPVYVERKQLHFAVFEAAVPPVLHMQSGDASQCTDRDD